MTGSSDRTSIASLAQTYTSTLSTSNARYTQPSTSAHQQRDLSLGSSNIKITLPPASKPQADRPRIIFNKGSATEGDISHSQNMIPGLAGTLPAPRSQPGDHPPSRDFGGFTHSVEGLAAFQLRTLDNVRPLPD